MTQLREIFGELRRRAEHLDGRGDRHDAPGTAGNDLVTVAVDGRNRISSIVFTSRLPRVTSTRLAGAVLNAYVDACAAASPCRTTVRGLVETQAAERPVPCDGLEAYEGELSQHLAERELRAQEAADRLERVTATKATCYVSVTVTATGRLRRLTFEPGAAAAGQAVLARDVMSALTRAEAEARAVGQP